MKKQDPDALRKDIARALRSPEDEAMSSAKSRALARALRRKLRRAGPAEGAADEPDAEPDDAGDRPKVVVEFRLPQWRRLWEGFRRLFRREEFAWDSATVPAALAEFVVLLDEQPRLYHWFMMVAHSGRQERQRALRLMAEALREGDADPAMGEALEMLQQPSWFRIIHRVVEHRRKQEPAHEEEVSGRALAA